MMLDISCFCIVLVPVLDVIWICLDMLGWYFSLFHGIIWYLLISYETLYSYMIVLFRCSININIYLI